MPARAGTDQPPIGDYGIIGDCRTAALVSRYGSIDWLCLPRFDGGAVFSALLDSANGGRFRVAPVEAFEAERRYLEDTNVLETRFRTAGGAVRLTDAMTVRGTRDETRSLMPDHEVLRRVECTEGRVDMEVLCDPRFEFGRQIPAGSARGRAGIYFDGGSEVAVLRSDMALEPVGDAPGWHGRFTLQAGDRAYFSLTSAHAEPPVLLELGESAERRIGATVDWWREWIRGCSYRGPHREQVYRSMLVLKLLVFPPSGAILAAATTSLPEVPGGERNWDYRFCWLRDASMTLEVLLHLGFSREGEAFLGWLLHATRLTRPELQVLYDVYGRTERKERELSELAGYRGARPVRVGNGATNQLQLDLYGELLRAAWSFVEQGGRLDGAEADLVAELGGTVLRQWRDPDNGIWELRGERRHFTHSKAMCWVALECLLRMHDRGAVPLKEDRETVKAEQAAIGRWIEKEGWSDSLESYAAWPGADEVDAALLLLGIMGYQAPDGRRMRSTQERVRERLGVNGLLYRYRYSDNLPGQEGAFAICAFWDAELLARRKRLEEAEERFEFACSFTNDLGLLSEQIDPETGALLGNFPQAFSHIGLLSAANAIARGRGRPPERHAEKPEATEPQTRGSAKP